MKTKLLKRSNYYNKINNSFDCKWQRLIIHLFNSESYILAVVQCTMYIYDKENVFFAAEDLAIPEVLNFSDLKKLFFCQFLFRQNTTLWSPLRELKLKKCKKLARKQRMWYYF